MRKMSLHKGYAFDAGIGAAYLGNITQWDRGRLMMYLRGSIGGQSLTPEKVLRRIRHDWGTVCGFPITRNELQAILNAVCDNGKAKDEVLGLYDNMKASV